MFKIIKKNPQSFHHPHKFVRLMRKFDGSVTQIIKSLAGQLPKVDLLYQTQYDYSQTLANLQIQKDRSKIQRFIKLRNSQNQQVVLFGRSIWQKKAYEDIMQKNKLIPIGQNMINQKIQMFKEVSWVGIANINIDGQIFQNIQCRSSRFIINKNSICEVQQYFTDNFFSLFL